MLLLVRSREVTRALVGGMADRNLPIGRKAQIFGGFAASGLRLAAGMTVRRLGQRPTQRLRLWDFERCSFSRCVRETLSELDLDADIFPCPRGGTRYRGQLKSGVPQLEDPNLGITLVGSRNIVEHLHRHYGLGAASSLLCAKPIVLVTGILVRILTGSIGAHARPSRAPAQPLELWSFEASPYCRLVRARLSELELPYVLHNVAKNSPRRGEFVARSGKMQVPWLFDPNTGVQQFESLAIERYLDETYGSLAGAS